MKMPAGIIVFGDQDYRGVCPPESAEQITFFARLRREYPQTWGALAIHPRNEGKRHHAQTLKQKSEGMTAGSSDIVIPARIAFVCELKRRDHTKSAWQKEQVQYLLAAKEAGAFACVALGYEAAWDALLTWIRYSRC